MRPISRIIRRVSSVVMVLALALVTLGSMASAQRMNLSTATTGGAYYPAGIAVAQLLSEEIPGLQVSASTSAGSVENVILLATGEAQIAWVQADILENAFSGAGHFEGEAQSDLRILVPGVENHYNMVVDRESGIDSLEEWRGRRVVVGRVGSGAVITHEIVLGAFGITFDDIQPDYLAYNEGVEAIRNGRADAAIGVGAAPMSAVAEALAVPGSRVKLLNLSDEEVERITTNTPWISRMIIPAGTYGGVDYDVQTVGHVGYLVVNASMDEELVYNIVKTMYEHRDWLIATYPGWASGSFANPANALNLSVPLHPGAERYMKEAGLLE